MRCIIPAAQYTSGQFQELLPGYVEPLGQRLGQRGDGQLLPLKTKRAARKTFRTRDEAKAYISIINASAGRTTRRSVTESRRVRRPNEIRLACRQPNWVRATRVAYTDFERDGRSGPRFPRNLNHQLG